MVLQLLQSKRESLMAVGVHRLPLGELLRRNRRSVVVFLDCSGATWQCVLGLGAQQLAGGRLRWQALGIQGQRSRENVAWVRLLGTVRSRLRCLGWLGCLTSRCSGPV